MTKEIQPENSLSRKVIATFFVAMIIIFFGAGDNSEGGRFAFMFFSLVLIFLAFPVLIIGAALASFSKNKKEKIVTASNIFSQTEPEITTIKKKLSFIFNSKILKIYLVIWGSLLLSYFFSAFSFEAPSFLRNLNPFLLFFGGMLFPGLHFIVNTSGSIWARIIGWVVVAVASITIIGYFDIVYF